MMTAVEMRATMPQSMAITQASTSTVTPKVHVLYGEQRNFTYYTFINVKCQFSGILKDSI